MSNETQEPARLAVHGTVHVLLDAEDYERLSRYRWSLLQANGQLYVRRGARLREFDQPSTILLSRAITGARPGQRVRHRNGHRLDFRRSNLVVTGTPKE